MINKLQLYVENVLKEMSKVTWPSKDELMNSSIVVVVISALFTLYVLFADVIISRLVGLLY